MVNREFKRIMEEAFGGPLPEWWDQLGKGRIVLKITRRTQKMGICSQLRAEIEGMVI